MKTYTVIIETRDPVDNYSIKVKASSVEEAKRIAYIEECTYDKFVGKVYYKGKRKGSN